MEELSDFAGFVGVSWRPVLLARLHEANVVSEDLRRRAAATLEDNAMDFLDDTWTQDEVVTILNPSELAELKARFVEEVLPNIDDLISESADGFVAGTPASERYAHATDSLRSYINVVADGLARRELERALERIETTIDEDEGREEAATSKPSLAPNDSTQTEVRSNRDQFDDVHF